MAVKNQLKADTERLADLINRYTGIPSSRIKEFVAEHGAEYILSSANRLAKTDTQREKLHALFEFKSLYEIVKGNEKSLILNSTEKALNYFTNYLGDRNDKERVAVAFLDSKFKVIATKIMSEGSVTTTNITPREIAREALYYNAVTVLLAHNHPSDVKQPSRDDIITTGHVVKALKAVDVELCDHIIVAKDQSISMADLGLIDRNEASLTESKAASPVSEALCTYSTTNKEGGNSIMNISNTTASHVGASANALSENEHVKELLSILNDNGKDASGLTALLDHVKGMEDFVKMAEVKIVEMKAQLDEMKEVQDHPIRAALQNTIKALEAKVNEIKAHIAEIKANIVEGCKNAVAAFKEKGAIVLDRLASFFQFKGSLQALKDDSALAAKMCDKSVASIESFSKEYHMANRHVKNMARIAIGKKPIDAVKESGRLTKIMCAPYKAGKAINLGICKLADKMIASLDRLERRAEAKRDDRASAAKKPPLMARLNEKKELIRQKEVDAPKLERVPRVKGLEV